ncbi:MAG: hypothetical protein HQK59_08155 [Deltaproteobacteria bacterium]|nr:hypothetical protein [Deltaproteobacteria bacterium]
MRKTLISPVLSGLILPGVGQLYNRQIAKGCLLIAITTVLFIALFMLMATDLYSVINSMDTIQSSPEAVNDVLAKVRNRDHTYLWAVSSILFAVWAISVVDAFRHGRAIDQAQDASRQVKSS